MVNTFLNIKTKNRKQDTIPINDIENANTILFSLFTRYGDTIIDLVVIKEFINKYPNKKYLILVPKQMIAYIKELIPDVSYFALNKRNIFDMIKVHFLLKKFNPDIAFNPWSNGMDSCYFLTYAKKYLCYKDYQRVEIINHYQVVREYLQLPKIKWEIKELKLNKNYQNILICPESTDKQRSISTSQLNSIIQDLLVEYNAKISMAYMDSDYQHNNCNNIVLTKNNNSSTHFLNTMKQSDLIICADSAPLHLATALKKDIIAYFYITSPSIVLNSNSSVKVVKNG
jgi:ADP-heptose:LPS heptosyltransferase